MSETPFADAAAKTAVAEESEEERAAREEAEAKSAFFDSLKERFGENAPTEQTLDQWKAEAGRVRWFEFGTDEIYFFRPFRSAEYNGWIQSLEQLAGKDPEKADRILKERIVCACVLFPKLDPENTAALFAGTIDSLFAQIRFASNFIPLEMANTMVREW